MRMIYLLLCKTNTLLSRLIHIATHDEYTHVSISLDADLTELYSFARLQSYFPLPAYVLLPVRIQAACGIRRGEAAKTSLADASD